MRSLKQEKCYAVAFSGARKRFTLRSVTERASTALIVFAFQLTACATCAREGFVHGEKGSDGKRERKGEGGLVKTVHKSAAIAAKYVCN